MGAGGMAAGGTATTGGGGSGGDVCEHTSYPEPPKDHDLGGEQEFVVAMNSIGLGETLETRVGVDLDRQCTCLGEGPSCVAPPNAGDNECDFDGGVDSNFSRLMTLLAAFSSGTISSSAYSQGALDGRWSVLLRVRGYNGAVDDDQVEVAVFTTPGFPPDEVPLWDGTDEWPIASTSVGASGSTEEPKFVSLSGYVRDGILVAPLPSLPLIFNTGFSYLPFDITGGFIMGTIVEQAGETALTNGLIAGRFTMESMFQSLSEFRNGAGMPICRGDSYYDSVKILVCNLRDISSEVPGPGASCDSISMGVGFTAQPAKLGAVGDNLAPSPGCPAETTPATDSCPD